ncbi:MAG: hypothetical protein QG564_1844 [Campylobacterota bacterium]|nr:hypothetical protein [Campylobacterota bacterium]
MKEFNRKNLLEEAYTWIDTKYQHQGRLKKTDKHKGGVDCAGFVIGVANTFEYETPEATNYSFMPDKDLFKNTIEQYLVKINMEDLKAGDLLIFAFDQYPQHIAMVSNVNPIRIIHSFATARKVTEHDIDEVWQKRIRGAYRFKNLKD